MSRTVIREFLDYVKFRQWAEEGKLKKLKKMVEGKSKDAIKQAVCSRGDGVHALILAARGGHLSVVKFLLNECNANADQEGIYIHEHGEATTNALWHACVTGNYLIAKVLLEYGCSPNPNCNPTVLMAACVNRDFEMVKLLVEHGSSMDIKDNSSFNALMIACCMGELEIFKYLVEKGGDILASDSFGNSLMMLSILHGQPEISKYIVTRALHQMHTLRLS